MTRTLALSLFAVWLAAAVGPTGSAWQVAQPAGSADVKAQMQHHFAEVSRMHDALVRGDLAAVRTPALELVAMRPAAAMPAAGAPQFEAMRAAGRRAAEADTLDLAAAAVASMLTLCGGCHASAGVGIAPSYAPRANVEGLAGDMIEHQRGVDQLLQGLFIPSASQWRQGADRLRRTGIDPETLPRELAVTAAARQAGARVRVIAEQAVSADGRTAQAAIYAQLVTTCAECHGQHNR